MKKLTLKIKNKVKLDKNLTIFLFVLLIIGIISGSIFAGILNESDKILVDQHLNSFLTNIEVGQVDYFSIFKSNLISSLFNSIIIWLLGMSIIGIIVIVVMFFSSSFILGFTIGSVISTFGFKGCLFALIYSFPFEIINLLMLLILVMYAMSFSFKLIFSIFKKQTVNFKLIINRYTIILLITLGINIINTLYNSYLMPNIIKSVINFIR